MGVQTFYDSFAANNTREDMAAYLLAAFSPEKQAAELADPTSVFLIAEVDAVPVGYARVKSGDVPPEVRGPRPIELVRLYAHKGWIGQGIGAALMKACLDEARRRDYQSIWLGVRGHNARALAFYRRWGFRPVGTHVFQLGGDAQTDYILEKALGGPG